MPANSFDYSIISFVNQFAGKSAILDKTLVFLSNNDLFKGSVFMLLFCWEWFSRQADITVKRQRVISGIIGAFSAMFVIRVITKFTHFRARPMFNPDNHWVAPISFDISRIPNTHNSFPSDHATLFFALATGMCFVSRRLGIFSLLYALLFICFPRIYVGYHYPTDILGGAFAGVLFALIANTQMVRQNISDKLLSYSESNPPLFYSVFFLLGFQIATLFDSSRDFLHFLGTLAGHH